MDPKECRVKIGEYAKKQRLSGLTEEQLDTIAEELYQIRDGVTTRQEFEFESSRRLENELNKVTNEYIGEIEYLRKRVAGEEFIISTEDGRDVADNLRAFLSGSEAKQFRGGNLSVKNYRAQLEGKLTGTWNSETYKFQQKFGVPEVVKDYYEARHALENDLPLRSGLDADMVKAAKTAHSLDLEAQNLKRNFNPDVKELKSDDYLGRLYNNRDTIVANPEKWFEFVMEHADRTAIELKTPQKRAEFFKEMFQAIHEGSFYHPEASLTGVASKLNVHRALKFSKWEKRFEYDQLFGEPNPHFANVQTYNKIAKNLAIMEKMGSNPEKMFSDLFDFTFRQAKDPKVKQKLISMEADLRKLHRVNLGEHEAPAHTMGAQLAQGMMNTTAANSMGGSWVSSIDDWSKASGIVSAILGTDRIKTVAMTMKAYVDSFGAGGTEFRNRFAPLLWLQAESIQGANLEINGFSAESMNSVTGKMAQFTTKYSGLQRHVSSARLGTAVPFSMLLADALDQPFENLSAAAKNGLRRWDITTPEDWKMLQEGVSDISKFAIAKGAPEGAYRLAMPEGIRQLTTDKTASEWLTKQGRMKPIVGEIKTPYEYTPVDVYNKTTAGIKVYHGSKKGLGKLSDADVLGTSNVKNLFGDGLYVTDSLEMAKSYNKKGQGTVLGARLNALKLVDLEQRLPDHAWEVFKKQMSEFMDDKEISALRDKKGTDVYRAMKESFTDAGLYESDVVDIYQNFNAALSAAGIDGFRHEGGIKGGQKHNVFILLEDKLKSKFTDMEIPKPEIGELKDAVRYYQSSDGMRFSKSKALAEKAGGPALEKNLSIKRPIIDDEKITQRFIDELFKKGKKDIGTKLEQMKLDKYSEFGGNKPTVKQAMESVFGKENYAQAEALYKELGYDAVTNKAETLVFDPKQVSDFTYGEFPKELLDKAKLEVAMKLGNMINSIADMGSSTPDTSTIAFITQGRSIDESAIRRLLFQFKSAAITNFRTYRTILNSGADRNGNNYAALGQTLAMNWALNMVKVYARDAAQGKTPRDPLDPQFAAETFFNSGILGVAGDIGANELTKETTFGRTGNILRSLAGPSVSTIAEGIGLGIDVGANILTGGQIKGPTLGQKAVRIGTNIIPFPRNLPYTVAITNSLLLNGVKEAVDAGYVYQLEKQVRSNPGLLGPQQEYFMARPSENKSILGGIFE